MNFLNKTSNDEYSSIIKFLDCSTLNSLRQTSKMNNKNIIKYKNIYKEIKLKNIFGKNTYHLLNQKYNISSLYKNRNSIELYIESFKIWLEYVCKNKKIIDFSEYYGICNYNMISIIPIKYYLKNILYRNNIIKKYFTKSEIEKKII